MRYYVDGIAYQAFKNCTKLKSVTFHRNTTVRYIAEEAFYGCSALTQIEIPGSIKKIEPSTFYEASQLSKVILNEGVESIDTYAFYDNNSLSEITIPSTLKSINYWVFSSYYNKEYQPIRINISDIAAWCKIDFATSDSNPLYKSNGMFLNGEEVTSVTIPDDCSEVKPYVFFGYKNLQNIIFNEGLQSIGHNAFSGCEGLTSLSFNNNLTSIGEHAFSGCNGLTSVTFNNSLQTIGGGAFSGCEGLTSLVFKDNLLSIGSQAFFGCNYLKSIVFNDGLQIIDNEAFMLDGTDYSTLESVIIPGSVTKIGYYAIPLAKEVIFNYGSNPITVYQSAFAFATKVTCDRELKGFTSDSFTNTVLESLTIGNNVKEIPAGKFKNLDFNTVKLGSNVTSIGENAFKNCTGLTEVVLPPSVETIGASAFDGATSLSSVIMGSKVYSIGENAFNGCPVTEIKITAPTPPSAAANTFSDYSAKLYVQGQDAADAYYDAMVCWDSFCDSDDPIVMAEPTSIEMEKKTISGKPGDTFQLTATLKPENVTLPHIFWRSTNPEIATVDENGLVTLHQEMSGIMTMAENGDDAGPCRIIAESLYANGPVAEVTVNASSSDIDNIFGDNKDSGEIDYSAPYEVYNLQGMKVGTTTSGLIPGIYIIRQGSVVKKIAVR